MNNSITIKSHELNLNKITKKVILECLIRIKVDHGISISEQDLEAKVNLLYDDCKNMVVSQFIEKSELIRKSKLYGRLPTNYEFLEHGTNCPILFKLNSIVGFECFHSVELGDVVKITCVAGMKTKAYSLPTETKDKIKAQFKQPIEIK